MYCYNNKIKIPNLFTIQTIGVASSAVKGCRGLGNNWFQKGSEYLWDTILYDTVKGGMIMEGTKNHSC